MKMAFSAGGDGGSGLLELGRSSTSVVQKITVVIQRIAIACSFNINLKIVCSSPDQ
jgi:hypothetical protein